MATVWTSLTRLVDTTAATLLPHHWRPGRALQPTAPAVAGCTDAITGLPDRAAFEQALDDAVHGCDARQHTLAVVYIGLDNFRLVNEGYGHAVGDALLAQVPPRLRQAVPAMVGAMRNAGDEFVLLLPGDGEAAGAAAQRLRDALRQPFRVDGVPLTVDVSIGIALYPRHGARARLVLQAAAAMRSVKQAGGGAHAEFEPAMGVDMRQQAELLRDLRHAVELQALQLVYQPKVDARTRQVTGAEALLRWHDERRGVVSPAVFVPLAEKHGIIAGIGRWVIEEACRQAAAWRDQGLWLRVAVNVSGQQLRQDDWVEHLVASLRQHQVPPSRFTVEITESVAMEDTGVTREAFERLRQAGVHVAIDDFGTGHSSLASLRKLPAAELKIDRAFITDLDSSGHARAIVSTVVHMAHELDLRVVAEGVETDAQRDWLLHMGCDELQGYLFARPMSAAALAVWALDERGNGLAAPPPPALPPPAVAPAPVPMPAAALR
ncbi:putative bifunctional diguanylate cyclase/phosphodiesterase [Pseudorhodoferax sp.]|uniref:putative bifunctional diguanylate cyclase/phosphodiesterase n=1 Tax=Pseudorhodoferax sp. TaxID=1993553 RepID=UPI002DD61913|nr:bifunctional diguanylate cyclase/phosphodiesterase [Pseudorhodoferax sp.]